MANIEKKKDTKPAKAKKESRFNPVRFFKEMVAELKKLTWPTKKDLISRTGAVLAFVIGIAIVIGLLDFLLGSGIGLLMNIGG